MEQPPIPPFPLAIRALQEEQNSKKLASQGASSSSSSMDAEVVEIPPPVPLSSEPLKQKEGFVHEVIDVDKDEDIADSSINLRELNKLKKGKAVMDVSDGPINGYSEDSLAEHIFFPVDDLIGAINGTEPKGLQEGSNTSSNGDGQIYGAASYDSDYVDYILKDAVPFDDNYDLLQAHFDSMDIPPGVEARVPWFPGMSKNDKKSDAGNGVHSSGSLHAETAGFRKETESFGLTKPAPVETNGTFTGTSASHGQAYSASHPPQVNLSAPWLSIQSMQSKKNRAGYQRKGSVRNFSFGLEPFKSQLFLESFRNKMPPVSSSNTTNFSSASQIAGANCPSGVDHFNWGQSMPHGVEKQSASVSSSNPSFPENVSGSPSFPILPLQILSQNKDSTLHPFKTFPSFPLQIFSQNKDATQYPFKKWLKNPSNYPVNHLYASPATYSSHIHPFTPLVYTLPVEDGDSQLPQSSSGDDASEIDDVLRRFENFKHFDTVQDHSDHYYSKYGSAVKQPSKNWAKRIQEEWKILEKDLPDNIFIRVYETRIDLLRAVIIGAEGTPYHDGLYFFDIFFPPSYPQTPPHVYYQSRGLRLNPNLYSSGKVCLSLLNTWTGQKNEKWMPGVSTILQVLVSIQGLILNATPYFNEPGYERTQGSASGDKWSLRYNEDTFILSLRMMTYVIKAPPKHFEDFVMGHFSKRARDILMACKAYMEGARVGCLVKGGEQDVDAGEEGRSSLFNKTLAGYIGILARAFMKIGVKDCEEFLTPSPPAEETKMQVGGVTTIDHLD